MLDDYGFEIYEENPYPIAYLLTFRTYASWLHGDEGFSVDRNGNTTYGTPRRDVNVPLKDVMRREQKAPSLILDGGQRTTVHKSIVSVCEHRGYLLRALNVRSNHAHIVVSAAVNPEKPVNEFKAYATRALRAEQMVGPEAKIWSRGASTRYLWKPKHVDAAVDYVKYCQEDVPFEFREMEERSGSIRR